MIFKKILCACVPVCLCACVPACLTFLFARPPVLCHHGRFAPPARPPTRPLPPLKVLHPEVLNPEVLNPEVLNPEVLNPEGSKLS